MHGSSLYRFNRFLDVAVLGFVDGLVHFFKDLLIVLRLLVFPYMGF